ncbi:WD40 repeat domain-containing protein [Commensalibacter sp. M0134]|uniref:WD40 repeat domain-containing protein n=1 Tax=Commensalibacter TaxID=1079922 RepID=UPI0018DB6018|nr:MULTISPECIES: WD40 repeat domain-containing protein [Commensalibacter]MBI0066533.1 WD40 repeat domain-containing protein [Commensalibacter sp. M0134]MBI0070437.1 WD40 repeat domain-containing protein [Commensalibacter sp. M0133]MBI0081848.1 WD40 repeat domain-containing protein [Commensalibacter melissae]
MNQPLQLIESRGSFKKVEGTIIACATSWDEQYSAFATADGDLWIIPLIHNNDPDYWYKVQPHDGGILSLSQDLTFSGFVTSGDDNKLVRIIPGKEPQQLLKSRRWIDKIVSWTDKERKQNKIAFITGKEIYLYKDNFTEPYRIFEHSSGVSDLVFSLDGAKIASSYYNGATLWSADYKNPVKIKDFTWKGSHTGITLHPKEEALVTSMQDHDLHGWRISDGHNMRMSGYPTKVKSLNFSSDGKWLATSGAEPVVLWQFFGGGPMGKPPVELPGIPGSCCMVVACHPTYDMVAAGFLDGSILLIGISDEKVIPVNLGSKKSIGEITALQFNEEGSLLNIGTDDGYIILIDLSEKNSCKK